MEAHIKSSRVHRGLSWLYGGLALVSLLFPYIALTGSVDQSVAYVAKTFFFFAFFGCIFVVHHLVARGVRERKEWARVASRIIAASMCLAFPIGTAIGIYLFVNSSWRKPSDYGSPDVGPSDPLLTESPQESLPPLHRRERWRRVALWVYIVMFVCLSVHGAIDDESTAPASLLVSAVDVAVSLLTIAGLFFYALRARNRRLIASWRVIAPLLPATEILLLIPELPELLVPDPDFTVAETTVLLAFALVFVSALLVPAFVINFRFAKGRHLTGADLTSVP
jgi:hypothetical protein